MKEYELDEEEKEISAEIERGEWGRNEELYHKYKKKALKRITINLIEEDIEKAKKLSEKTGIPYQTLISSILHRYFNGKIEVKEPF